MDTLGWFVFGGFVVAIIGGAYQVATNPDTQKRQQAFRVFVVIVSVLLALFLVFAAMIFYEGWRVAQ